MKRKIIKNYESLPPNLLELVREKYPDGFSSSLISFFGPDGKLVSGFLLETEEIISMVRVNIEKSEKKEDEEDIGDLEKRDEEDEDNYIIEEDQVDDIDE